MGPIINVLGLGPSLELYNPDSNISIGVNDIWSRVKTDYVVCLDLKERFTPERLESIENCKPIKFYSIFPTLDEPKTDWSDRADFEKIELQPYYPKYECQLNLKQLPKSFCSPFVACAIAFNYFHASEIHVYGVDLFDHPNLDKKTCADILKHFQNLQIALVMTGSKLVIHGDGILKAL